MHSGDYATDFPRTRKNQRRLFVVVAMIPKETSADDRGRLLETLSKFMHDMVIFE